MVLRIEIVPYIPGERFSNIYTAGIVFISADIFFNPAS